MSTAPDAVRPEQAQEDVELLARDLMGWKRGSSADYVVTTEGRLYWHRPVEVHGVMCREPYEWNPLTDANADLMVLERAREVWGQHPNGVFFCATLENALADRNSDESAFWEVGQYRCGDYARCALAELRPTALSDKGE